MTAMQRCDREIAAIKDELRSGNPDVEGAILGLSDWRDEKRMIYEEFLATKRVSVRPSGFVPRVAAPRQRRRLASVCRRLPNAVRTVCETI
jgi:hypothetical protein